MSKLLPAVTYRIAHLTDIDVSYREAVPVDRDITGLPTVVLLHGFPSGAHMFHRLIDILGSDYHVIAPEYPGFGPVDVAESLVVQKPWTFEWLTEVMKDLLNHLGIRDFIIYAFDWGGPIGFRLALRNPSGIQGLILQNANIYEEGLSESARTFIALNAEERGASEKVHQMLQESNTMGQYLTGVRDAQAVPPESWLIDQAYLDRGVRTKIQVQLAFDYKNNLLLYPQWQEWLRDSQPPTLIV